LSKIQAEKKTGRQMKIAMTSQQVPFLRLPVFSPESISESGKKSGKKTGRHSIFDMTSQRVI
jgi:hypothetical protein